MTDTPNPGSKEALAQNCKCPVIDNNYGLGAYVDKDGVTLFWYNAECPIHGHLLLAPSRKSRR